MAHDQHPFAIIPRGQPRNCNRMLCTMNRKKARSSPSVIKQKKRQWPALQARGQPLDTRKWDTFATSAGFLERGLSSKLHRGRADSRSLR
jgi:hypothetical protein